MIKFKDFYVSDSDYEEQMELFQNEYPNAEFIQITGGHMSPERIWFKYDDKLKEQPKLSIPKKIAELLDIAIEGLTKFEDFLWAVDEFDVLIPNDKVEYFRNWTNEEPNAHALAVAYVTGKALGVELVEATDE